MAWDTAGQIVNDAAVECGLAASADPFASADPNFIRLCRLLKSCGRELVNKASWSHLASEYLFSTITGQQIYPVPPDWRSPYDESQWSRTTRLPLGGPLSPQEWQYLAARQIGISWTILWRPQQGAIYCFPAQGATPGPLVIALEYRSNWWVQQNPNAGVATPAWAQNTQYVVGQYVRNLGDIYVCTTPGESSATPGGPSSPGGAGIVDNTVRWAWTSGALVVANAWVANTGYIQGQTVTANGNTYICCSVKGFSSNSGTGPSNFGASYDVGTVNPTLGVIWKYVWGGALFPISPTSDAPSSSSDIVLLDKLAIMRRLKWAFLEDTGFDFAGAQTKAEATLSDAISNDSPSPILSLNGRRRTEPLLSRDNLPFTGFGGVSQ